MPTVKEIAERTKSKQLTHLLETEHLAIDPELSVDVKPQAEVKKQVAAVLEALLLAVLKDESIDGPARISRVKEILEAQEKPESKSHDNSKSQAKLAEKKTDEGLANQFGKLTEAVAQLNSENSARRVLESAGINAADLDPENMKLLESQKSEDEMKRLVESWPGYIKTPNRVFGRFTESANTETVKAPANGKEMARQLK